MINYLRLKSKIKEFLEISVDESHYTICGREGDIIPLSSEHVAKVPPIEIWNQRLIKGYKALFWTSALIRAHSINAQLYEDGVSTPKPKGLYRLNFNEQSVLPSGIPAYVMENLLKNGGINASDSKFRNLPNAEQEFAQRIYEEELTKARKLGYSPCDEGKHNYFYNPSNGLVKLIDFAGWKSPHKTPKINGSLTVLGIFGNRIKVNPRG